MRTLPLKVEALLERSYVEIPGYISLNCNTEVYIESNTCIKDGDGEKIVAFSERLRSGGWSHPWLNTLRSLQGAGKIFIIYGKKLKQAVMDSCPYLRELSNTVPHDNYRAFGDVQEIADCIQESSTGGNNVRSRVSDSDSKETTTALPTGISEFYNTTIRPFIESQTEFSTTIGSPYANSNTTSETPLGISGKALESSNSTIYTTVGGAVAAGVLISGIAAVAWTWKRKTLNEKQRKRYQEMITSTGGQLVKSSENNSVIPQNAIV